MELDQDARVDAGWEVAAIATFESFPGSVNMPLSWGCRVGLGKDIIHSYWLGRRQATAKVRIWVFRLGRTLFL